MARVRLLRWSTFNLTMTVIRETIDAALRAVFDRFAFAERVRVDAMTRTPFRRIGRMCRAVPATRRFLVFWISRFLLCGEMARAEAQGRECRIWGDQANEHTGAQERPNDGLRHHVAFPCVLLQCSTLIVPSPRAQTPVR